MKTNVTLHGLPDDQIPDLLRSYPYPLTVTYDPEPVPAQLVVAGDMVLVDGEEWAVKTNVIHKQQADMFLSAGQRGHWRTFDQNDLITVL